MHANNIKKLTHLLTKTQTLTSSSYNIIATELAKGNPFLFELLDENLRNDPNIVASVLAYIDIQEVGDELKNNEDFIMEYSKHCDDLINCASTKLRLDRAFNLRLVLANPNSICHIHESHRNASFYLSAFKADITSIRWLFCARIYFIAFMSAIILLAWICII